MIVNPQLFNYKLIIGTLAISCLGLIGLSYYNYSSALKKQEFIIQEKKLLENQISEMISSHDELGKTNRLLLIELDAAKRNIDRSSDSLLALNSNLSLIDVYKNELFVLKKQYENSIKQGASFSKTNLELIKENEYISNMLDKQLEVIKSLKKENENLDTYLKSASLVLANSFNAIPYSKKNSGEILEVSKASKTNNIKVSFVLAENKLATKEDKDLYIQIIGPDNNVVSDKGAVSFDNSSLIYSTKVNVVYDKETKEVISNIKTKETLIPGLYYVNVYDKNRRLGGTQFSLN